MFDILLSLLNMVGIHNTSHAGANGQDPDLSCIRAM